MGTPRFEGQTVVVRRRAWFLWASLAGSAVNLLPPSVVHSSLWLRPLAMYFGVAFLFLFMLNVWSIRRPAKLRADADGLWIDGTLAVRRDKIVSGYALAGPPPAVRILQKTWRALPFDLELTEPDAPRALLEALGLGVSGSTARFGAIHGGMRRQLWVIVAVGLGVGLAAVILAFAIFAMPGGLSLPLAAAAVGVPMLLGILAVLRSQTKLIVGADGVFVSRLGSKEFIPFEELSSVRQDEGDVIVERLGKSPLRLGFGAERMLGREGGVYRDAFVERIKDARATHAASVAGGGASAPRVAALVARGTRTASEWLASIRALAADGSYRDSALMPDQFLRVVEDPAAEPSARAGAAMALRPMLDDVGRERVRIAAETCAAPALKAALEAAVKEQAEAEALEEAMDAVSTTSTARA